MAHKECMANGSWFRHPETGQPWSNYTTCIKPEDVGITAPACAPEACIVLQLCLCFRT